jgi:hypothetical protein
VALFSTATNVVAAVAENGMPTEMITTKTNDTASVNTLLNFVLNNILIPP